MSTRLLILSDLWGAKSAPWLDAYLNALAGVYDIQYYDCCQLGGLDTSDYTEAALHQQFLSFGIDKAVAQLCQLEPHPVHVLGFSVGGTIGWKYALANTKVASLIAISATRIRHETTLPNTSIKLYYGEQDPYIPSPDWFSRLNLNGTILPNLGHQLYTNTTFIEQLCESMTNGL